MPDIILAILFLILMGSPCLFLIIRLSKVDVSFFIALIFAVVFSLICINLFIIFLTPYDFDTAILAAFILYNCIPIAIFFIIKLIIRIVKILKTGSLNNWRNNFAVYYRVYADDTDSRSNSISKFSYTSYFFSAVSFLLFVIFTSFVDYSSLFWYVMFSAIAAGFGVAAFFNSIVIYTHLKSIHKVQSTLAALFSIPLFVAYYFIYAIAF